MSPATVAARSMLLTHSHLLYTFVERKIKIKNERQRID